MATVALRFSPPDVEDLVRLTIYESVIETGPYVQIEAITAVGSYPDYIDHYTTTLANSTTGWFAIQWMDTKGALTDMSAPVKGGDDSLVWEVVSRVRQRDPTIPQEVIVQEAEAAIQQYFGGVDPYDPDLTATYSELNGFVYISMARAYLTMSATSGDIHSATIGLVTMRTGTGGSSAPASIEALIEMANNALNTHYSVVMLLEQIEIGNSIQGITWRDQSRLMLEIQIP